MALKNYTVDIGGIPHTMQLDEADRVRLSKTHKVTEVKATPAKAATKTPTKAAPKPKDKAAPAPADKTAQGNDATAIADSAQPEHPDAPPADENTDW